MALNNLRAATGSSLNQIARATGISTPYLSKIFSGKRTPRYDRAMKIAAYLGVSLDEFYVSLQPDTEANLAADLKVLSGGAELVQ